MRKDQRADLVKALVDATLAARENNASFEMMDPDNRRWFVGCANVDNRSHILIQAQLGQDIRESYLPTDTFTQALAETAINDLDGALK